jgi:uncharacterized membrane protein
MHAGPPVVNEGFITTSRLLSLSDGVFSIAITLLVFNLKVPILKHPVNEQDLPAAIFEMMPDFISYFLSFFVIGIYWVFHHWMFHYIIKVDNPLIIFNMLLLLFISFLPFPSALMGAYGEHPFTAIFYLCTLSCTGVVSLLMWRHATKKRRLVQAHLSDSIINTYYRRLIVAIFIFILAIPLSYFDTTAANYSLLLIVPLQLLIRKMHQGS